MPIKKSVALISVCGLLSACAEPRVVAPAGEAEAALDCQALSTEIASARQAETEARSEDRAKASYLLIVPAYVSWYRMDKAEEAARLRRAQLERLASEKHCPLREDATPAKVAEPQ